MRELTEEESGMIEEVRIELLRVRQDRQLTYQDLALRIKKPSGERYHPKTVALFLQQARPDRNWTLFALDAARGWSLGSMKFCRRRKNGV